MKQKKTERGGSWLWIYEDPQGACLATGINITQARSRGAEKGQLRKGQFSQNFLDMFSLSSSSPRGGRDSKDGIPNSYILKTFMYAVKVRGLGLGFCHICTKNTNHRVSQRKLQFVLTFKTQIDI